MRVPRIHSETALSAATQLQLPPATARRLREVLRLSAGAKLILFDGGGGEYAATLRRLDAKRALVDVGDFLDVERESPLRVEIGLALSLGERFDYAIQKAAELGVSAVAPLRSERSELKLDEARQKRRLARWRRVLIHACEQSGRTRLPELTPLQTLPQWLGAADGECKWMPTPEAPPIQWPATCASASILIGPEGGFSDAEIAQAEDHGFAPVALGPRVLRTETAPLAALTLLQNRYGDL